MMSLDAETNSKLVIILSLFCIQFSSIQGTAHLTRKQNIKTAAINRVNSKYAPAIDYVSDKITASVKGVPKTQTRPGQGWRPRTWRRAPQRAQTCSQSVGLAAARLSRGQDTGL